MRKRLRTQGWTREELQRVAEEGYVYGYPLVLMDVMRRIHTAVPFPTNEGAPLNQFWHSRFLPEPHAKTIPRPHADSLRSSAWLDLSKEPVILTIPPTDRFYVFSIFSACGDLIDTISPRTKGMDGGKIAFIGPGWHGKVPAGIKRLGMPSETVWINGRIQAVGAEDLQIVHSLQDEFRLTPLSDWSEPVSPHAIPFRANVEKHISAEEQVANLPANMFYTRLARLMRKFPPRPCDAPIVHQLAEIGFFPSEDFAFETLSPVTIQAMHAAVPAAKLTIARAAGIPAMQLNNWAFRIHPRGSETNYLSRAAAASNLFWHSLAEDVAAFHAMKDRAGETLRGANEYVIQFDHEHVPPVNAFWSITVYDSKRFLSANSIHRHVIGDRDRLRLNSDNSISIHIQHAWPGTTKDSNWLPAPRDAFELVLQLYWPKDEVLNGTWRPPALTRIR